MDDVASLEVHLIDAILQSWLCLLLGITRHAIVTCLQLAGSHEIKQLVFGRPDLLWSAFVFSVVAGWNGRVKSHARDLAGHVLALHQVQRRSFGVSNVLFDEGRSLITMYWWRSVPWQSPVSHCNVLLAVGEVRGPAYHLLEKGTSIELHHLPPTTHHVHDPNSYKIFIQRTGEQRNSS